MGHPSVVGQTGRRQVFGDRRSYSTLAAFGRRDVLTCGSSGVALTPGLVVIAQPASCPACDFWPSP